MPAADAGSGSANVYAQSEYEVRLQVGRVLRGWALVAAVALRNLFWSALTWLVDDDEYVAPAWVVVIRRADGQRVGRIAAGREPGDRDELLAAVQASLQQLSPEQFRREWGIDGGMGT